MSVQRLVDVDEADRGGEVAVATSSRKPVPSPHQPRRDGNAHASHSVSMAGIVKYRIGIGSPTRSVASIGLGS